MMNFLEIIVYYTSKAERVNMKKLLVLIFSVFFLFAAINFCYAFEPKYSDSSTQYGIGVYFAPKTNDIYPEPEENSEAIERIRWDNSGVHEARDDVNSKQVFIAFEPEKNIALFSVIDENDNWYQIVYNQNKGSKGWVKKSGGGKFMSWLEFLEYLR